MKGWGRIIRSFTSVTRRRGLHRTKDSQLQEGASLASQKTWALKGVFYECCRMEGHCPLWFGRDLWEKPCANLATHEIKEGQIDGIDMKGIIVTYFQDGIGPKASDVYGGNGIKEGAVYISDNASAEQRSVL